MTTIVLAFKKIGSEDKTNVDNFCSSSKAEAIINESEINDVLQSFYTTIISNIQKSLGKGPGWIIDSAIDHTISIWKYNPLAGSSYIKLPKELDHPRRRLVNIQNIDDNEFFKWSIVKYLNPAGLNPERIKKADKEFPKHLGFQDMKFPVRARDIHKIKKKRIPSALVFLVMKIKKNIQSM